MNKKYNKFTAVAVKCEGGYNADIQGMNDAFKFANKDVRESLKITFDNPADAIKQARKVIEAVQSNLLNEVKK